MTLTRTQYYFFLLALSLSPFILYKTGWLLVSKPTVGTVIYIGETHGRNIGRQEYPIVQFMAGKDTITTYGDYNLPYSPGDDYPLRYNPFRTKGIRLNTFMGCWIDTLIWCTIFTVIISIVFLVEGIVPHGKMVYISLRGIIFRDKTT